MAALDLLSLNPVPRLLERVRGELSADFRRDRPTRISRAPGRLDVMGGIADYTGSMVCEMPLACAAAVAMQERDDRDVQVFSFNLLDEHRPFTLRMPMGALAEASADSLRRDFNEPGRRWAAYLVGCLFLLHEEGFINLRGTRGLSLALLSDVPIGAGVSSSAAVEVATMVNLVDHYQLRDRLWPERVAEMCQSVENRVVGAPCGIMDQVTSLMGEAGAMLRMVCQPDRVLPPLTFPAGVRAVGIDSGVKHSVGGGAYGRTRCAAFMGHAMILATMRAMGERAGKAMETDPMGGYLANLDPVDYKKYFRMALPEAMSGREFIDRHGATIDPATAVEPEVEYRVQAACDHHVLEARRVRRFVEFVEAAGAEPDARRRHALLDKAGHLMYASHLSYVNDAGLGANECDVLMNIVRQREHAGLYGARITGGGCGGTVAVLCNEGERADATLGEILVEYERRTGRKGEVVAGTSPGAWGVGTAVVAAP